MTQSVSTAERKTVGKLAEPAWWQRKSVREGVWLSLVHAFLIVVAVVMVLPLFWLMTSAVKPEQDLFLYPPKWIPYPITWDNFQRAVTGQVGDVHGDLDTYGFNFPLYLRNTLIIIVGNIFVGVTASALVAYGLARLRFKGRDLIFYTVVGAMFLPGVVTLIPRYIIFARILHWQNTFLPLIVPGLFGYANQIFFLRQFFLTIPLELEDAAYVDGCSTFRFWWQILLPLCRAALVVQIIVTFMFWWNEFLLPLIYLQKADLRTLQVAVNYFYDPYEIKQGVMMAYSSVLVLPCLVVFFLAQRAFLQGIVFTGIKG